MKITIKESMLIRKCLGNYVSNQLLDYDKSPLFMDLMTKLKEYEKPSMRFDKNNIDSQRKALNKELKKYNYQTICNKKVLDMIGEERNNTPKNYVKNRLTYQEWLEIHHLNKGVKNV
tara:strand:- start:204 stop:554 length:351 start_codon:yes stop_codon:yes gene_type:complete